MIWVGKFKLNRQSIISDHGLSTQGLKHADESGSESQIEFILKITHASRITNHSNESACESQIRIARAYFFYDDPILPHQSAQWSTESQLLNTFGRSLGTLMLQNWIIVKKICPGNPNLRFTSRFIGMVCAYARLFIKFRKLHNHF